MSFSWLLDMSLILQHFAFLAAERIVVWNCRYYVNFGVREIWVNSQLYSLLSVLPKAKDAHFKNRRYLICIVCIHCCCDDYASYISVLHIISI